MIKHVILWKLKEMTEEEKTTVKANAKTALESLAGRIDGLVDIKVITNGLPSSNADMMLDSTFVSEEALAAYQSNPLHKEAAGTYVRPFYESRSCLDFEA